MSPPGISSRSPLKVVQELTRAGAGRKGARTAAADGGLIDYRPLRTGPPRQPFATGSMTRKGLNQRIMYGFRFITGAAACLLCAAAFAQTPADLAALEASAQRGDAAALNALAEKYRRGDEIARDIPKS